VAISHRPNRCQKRRCVAGGRFGLCVGGPSRLVVFRWGLRRILPRLLGRSLGFLSVLSVFEFAGRVGNVTWVLQLLIIIRLDKWTSLSCDGYLLDRDVKAIFFSPCGSHDFVIEEWIGVKDWDGKRKKRLKL